MGSSAVKNDWLSEPLEYWYKNPDDKISVKRVLISSKFEWVNNQ